MLSSNQCLSLDFLEPFLPLDFLAIKFASNSTGDMNFPRPFDGQPRPGQFPYPWFKLPQMKHSPELPSRLGDAVPALQKPRSLRRRVVACGQVLRASTIKAFAAYCRIAVANTKWVSLGWGDLFRMRGNAISPAWPLPCVTRPVAVISIIGCSKRWIKLLMKVVVHLTSSRSKVLVRWPKLVIPQGLQGKRRAKIVQYVIAGCSKRITPGFTHQKPPTLKGIKDKSIQTPQNSEYFRRLACRWAATSRWTIRILLRNLLRLPDESSNQQIKGSWTWINPFFSLSTEPEFHWFFKAKGKELWDSFWGLRLNENSLMIATALWQGSTDQRRQWKTAKKKCHIFFTFKFSLAPWHRQQSRRSRKTADG